MWHRGDQRLPRGVDADTWPPGKALSQDAALTRQLLRLQQENASLKNYAERVTKELRSARLSQAVAAAAAATGTTAVSGVEVVSAELQQQAETLPLPPWCLQMQLVSPLLAAYDERIEELQEEAKTKEKQINHFSEKVAAVTRENEQLAEELRSKTAQLQQVFEGEASAVDNGSLGVPSGAKTYNSLLQERNELEELYSLAAEQSDVLLNQNHLLKCHVQQSEAALDEMRAIVAETEKKAATVAEREEAVDVQENTLKQQSLQLREAIAKNTGLAEQLAASQKEAEKLFAALEEAEKIKAQQQQELVQLQAAAGKSAALQKELDQVREQLGVAAKETAAAKEVADYLEQRLAAQAQEMEEIRRQAENTTNHFHAAVIEKEKAAASAALLQQQVLQLRRQHDMELDFLRGAQGESLGKRAVQAEELADKLRQQLETLQGSHSEAVVKLETAERRVTAATADADQAREELANAIRHYQTVQNYLQQSQTVAEAELAKAKESFNLQSKEAAEKAAVLASSKRQLEDSLASSQSARLALQQQQQLLQNKCEQLQEMCNAQQQQLADAAAKLAAAEAETESARRRAEREIADLKRRCESLNALAEAKAARIQEAAERRLTAAAQRLLEEQHQRERLGKEYEMQKQKMQQQLAKAFATNAALRSKVNDLLSGLDKTLPTATMLNCDDDSDVSP